MIIDPSLAASAALGAANLLGAAASAATATDQSAATPKANDVVDQADFMKLLVAQLQNQDPLNPLDSANFSAQLAQFSSLEQLTQINQRLADQAAGADGAGTFEAVNFLGRDVQAASDALTVTDGVATTLDYTLTSGAAVQAQILDASGRQVAALVLPVDGPGTHRFDLATIANAPTLADGSYHVQLTVAGAGGTSTAVETTVQGRVTGIDLSTSPPVLLVDGRRVATTDVREIHESTAATTAS